MAKESYALTGAMDRGNAAVNMQVTAGIKVKLHSFGVYFLIFPTRFECVLGTICFCNKCGSSNSRIT
jgi:hypothetical protein